MNSAYMRRLGIRDDEPDPPLGSYDRRPGSSRLTGRIAEYARFSIRRKENVLAREPNGSAGLAARVKQFLKNGITSIQDMSNDGAARTADLWLESKLPLRVREIFFPFASTTCGDDPSVRQALPPVSKNILVSGCKWILDGAPSELTSAVNQPYAGLPGKRGVLDFTDAQLADIIRSAEAQHQQLLFHAIGGRAVGQLLRALESRSDIDWPSRRVRLEHGDGIEPGQMDRIARLGIIVVPNPAYFGVPPGVPVDLARSSFPQPVRTLLKRHIRLAFGSDGPWNPFANLRLASADQWQPQESLTREQAVIVYTYGSSFAEFREQDKGRLLPGQWADLAVLSQDIFTISAEQLPSTNSVLTMIGGQIVYDAKVLAVAPAPSR
jgi:predicted amidohydrolase YtcJ